MLVPGGQYKYVPMQVAATATGNGTAIETVDLDGGAVTTVTFQVTGISGDTITWEGTIDGTNWAAIQVISLATGTAATTATANGLYRVVVLGIAQIRARISTYGAGTIYVTGVACA